MSNQKPLYTKGGALNIKKIGAKSHLVTDFYYHLLKMKWRWFLLFFLTLYLLLNSLFAALYYIFPTAIQNAAGTYWDAWVFSFQTSTTLGYGYLYPNNTITNIIAVFDVVFGILFVAIATGIAFTKLSRPSSKIQFSKNILINHYNGKPTLTLRLGNQRTNEIIDARVNLVCLMSEKTSEGQSMRRLIDLKLERSRTPLLTLSWTLFHTIDHNSPLYNLTQEDINKQDINFIISFTGIDDVFSATIHDRRIYSSDQVLFHHYFEDIIETDCFGNRTINYLKFNNTQPAKA